MSALDRAVVSGVRRYYTDIFVTVNSNRSGRSGDDEVWLVNRWKEFMETQVWTADAMAHHLLVWKDTHPGAPLKIDITEPVVEAGPRYRKVHSHFTMSILHTGHLDLGPMLTAWHAYINLRAVPELSSGVNVQFRLLDTRSLNYNMKEPEGALLPFEQEVVLE